MADMIATNTTNTNATKIIQRTAPTSVLTGGKLPESISVNTVVFKAMQKVPGDHNCQSIRADQPANTGRYEITYITRINVLECVWHPSDKKHPCVQFFVPMTNVEYFA